MRRAVEAGARPSRDPAGRIEYIDGIRGVAALMVVVQHSLEAVLPGYLEWSLEYVNFGRIGVVAFFLVSGYVVGLTLTNQTPRQFLIRRFWRLYPVYWMATIAYVLVVVLTDSGLTLTLPLVLVNITMLQQLLGKGSILGVAWTLGMEVAFYLQSAAGKLLKVLDLTVWLGVAWFGWYLTVSVGAAAGVFVNSGDIPLMMFTASVGFSIYLWERRRSRALIVLAALMFVGVPVLGAVRDLGLQPPDGWHPLAYDSSYLLGIGLFALLYSLRSRVMPSAMLWLGALSYAMYLLHPTFIVLASALDVWSWVFVPAVVIATIASAHVTHRLLERPSISLGRRLSRPRSGVVQGVHLGRPGTASVSSVAQVDSSRE